MPIHLQPLLELQELDMKMLHLLKLRKEREKELHHIESLRSELAAERKTKEEKVAKLNTDIDIEESAISEIAKKVKTLENQQLNLKRIEEFQALTQQMNSLEREKFNHKKRIEELISSREEEETLIEQISISLKDSEENTKALVEELDTSIAEINTQGRTLHLQRKSLAEKVDAQLLEIYERLLHHRKDRVVVPLIQKSCMGCHIRLTAQHENSVRKADNPIFCEHCSRIHYWHDERARG